jgi:transposase
MMELDGKPNPTLEDVKGMLYADRIYLREVFDQMEGGVDSELKIKCDHCDKIFTSYLDIARIEFFSPKML